MGSSEVEKLSRALMPRKIFARSDGERHNYGSWWTGPETTRRGQGWAWFVHEDEHAATTARLEAAEAERDRLRAAVEQVIADALEAKLVQGADPAAMKDWLKGANFSVDQIIADLRSALSSAEERAERRSAMIWSTLKFAPFSQSFIAAGSAPCTSFASSASAMTCSTAARSRSRSASAASSRAVVAACSSS